MSDLNDRIRAVAYHLWERDGCPHGRQAEHWLEAEQTILGELEQTRAAAVKPAARSKAGPKAKAKPATLAAPAKPAAPAKKAAAPSAPTPSADKARRQQSQRAAMA